MKDPVTLSIERDIIKEIDGKKGKNVPRSRFIEDILSDYLVENASSVTSKPLSKKDHDENQGAS